MSEARAVHRSLKLVEYTAIPLSLTFLLYVLSGYGMLSSPILNVLGFTFITSTKIHTLPLLRYLTSVLATIHFYCGVVVLTRRRVKNARLREVLKALGLILAFLTVASTTASEIIMLLS
ncbi:MAG: hypothetical protein QXP80_02180 [Zestosphaera sp.]